VKGTITKDIIFPYKRPNTSLTASTNYVTLNEPKYIQYKPQLPCNGAVIKCMAQSEKSIVSYI
jgi:hypothetical protein